jgi:hypothetical protein
MADMAKVGRVALKARIYFQVLTTLAEYWRKPPAGKRRHAQGEDLVAFSRTAAAGSTVTGTFPSIAVDAMGGLYRSQSDVLTKQKTEI